MKTWTNEERYRLLTKNDSEELKELHKKVERSIWREDYHIQTVCGLLNDPNGFSYYNGKWHLFYQWFPFGPVHGMKHWYHVVSEDLVHWQNLGVAIYPDTLYENKGAYSGSGLVANDTLYLVYTGNHKDENMVRHPYQCLAKMSKDGKITKLPEPIISAQRGYTEHQRDPKLIYNKEDNYYYILLGAQRNDLTGTFLLYRSKEIEQGWEFHSELKVEGISNFGYMVECPDLEKIGNDYVLLFSPQGIEPSGDEFQNKFNTVYLVGSMDFEHAVFTPKDGVMRELDRGFDFYAAQCACQEQYNDAGILVGWFGCSDYSYPATDEEGYDGLLTLPRKLTVDGAKLKQTYANSYKKLCGNPFITSLTKQVDENTIEMNMLKSAVFHIQNEKEDYLKIQLWKSKHAKGFVIEYDPNTHMIIMDRSGLQNQFNTDYGTVRKIYLENGLTSLEIYQDRSSVEVFINDGEYVMSSRAFPELDENKVMIIGKAEVNAYDAHITVKDDFVVYK